MVATLLQIRRQALYGVLYWWLLAIAALDVLLTAVILSLGGSEANAFAAAVIARAGVPGMIALKLLSLATVIAICEYAGRRRPRTGHFLAQTALAANTAAVSVGCLFLVDYSLAFLAA